MPAEVQYACWGTMPTGVQLLLGYNAYWGTITAGVQCVVYKIIKDILLYTNNVNVSLK